MSSYDTPVRMYTGNPGIYGAQTVLIPAGVNGAIRHVGYFPNYWNNNLEHTTITFRNGAQGNGTDLLKLKVSNTRHLNYWIGYDNGQGGCFDIPGKGIRFEDGMTFHYSWESPDATGASALVTILVA